MNLPSVLHYAAAFIAALAILVVFHELGHYAVARFFRVRILRFSFGFGPLVWSRRLGTDQTEWAICALPLGGYVKMLDEGEGEVAAHEIGRAFNRQSVGRRALIVAAGPLANLLLAVALYAGSFMIGVNEYRAVLGVVPEGTPAAQARIAPGSTITRVNDDDIASWQDLRLAVVRDLLASDELTIETRSASGTVSRHVLKAPAGLGNSPERDSLDALGLQLPTLDIAPVVAGVLADSPAQAAGLYPGDQLLTLNGETISAWADFARHIREAPESPVKLTLLRAGSEIALTVTPQAITVAGERIGRIGLTPRLPAIEDDPRVTRVRYGPLDAVRKGVRMTWESSALTLRLIGRMIVGDISWRNISGPVTIADFAGQSAALGVSPYLSFLALVSISLGVLNLLPIPILDGGHLLYYLAEITMGRPLREATLEIAQRAGMALLGLLMLFALYNDFNRLVSG